MPDPKLIIEISGNSKKFDAELKKLEKSADASGKRTARNSLKRQKNLEKSLVSSYRRIAIASAALAVGVGVTLKAFANYEKAVVATIRTTGLAGQELEDFKKNIDRLSTSLNQPREGLLKIAEVAGTLGVTGAKNLGEFTKAMAQFDIASATLQGTAAADQIARIINLTGGDVGNVSRFASEIAFLADNFATTEARTAEVATELASVNALFRLSTLDTIDLAAAFSAFGITGEIARTAIAKFSESAEKALREGGDELKIFMSLTGQTRDELEETFFNSPAKFFENFVRGLGKTGKDARLILSELGLDQARLAKVFLTSADNVDVVTAALDRNSNEGERANKLAKETELALNTTAAKWDGVKVAVSGVTAEIGAHLAPTANTFFDIAIEKLTQIKNIIRDSNSLFEAFVEITKQATIAMGGLFGTQREAGRIFNGPELQEVDPTSALELLRQQEVAKAEIKDAAAQADIEREETKNEKLNEVLDAHEAERLEKEAEKAEAKREEKLAREQEQFDEDLETLQYRLDQSIDLRDESLAKEVLGEKKVLVEKAKLRGLDVKQERDLVHTKTQLAQIEVAAKLGAFGQILDGGTALSKGLFLVSKAAAFAETLVNTQKAYVAALAHPPGPPTTIPVATAVRASGYIAAASIAATAITGISSAQQGGIVPGGFGGGDRVPMMLEPGEIITPQRLNPLSPNFEETFGGGDEGGGQNINVMIGIEEDASRIITVKQREDRILGIQK